MDLTAIRNAIATYISSKVPGETVASDWLPEGARNGGVVFVIRGCNIQRGIEGMSVMTSVTFLIQPCKLTRAECDSLVEALAAVQFREQVPPFKYIQLENVGDVSYDPNSDAFYCSQMQFTGYL